MLSPKNGTFMESGNPAAIILLGVLSPKNGTFMESRNLVKGILWQSYSYFTNSPQIAIPIKILPNKYDGVSIQFLTYYNII